MKLRLSFAVLALSIASVLSAQDAATTADATAAPETAAAEAAPAAAPVDPMAAVVAEPGHRAWLIVVVPVEAVPAALREPRLPARMDARRREVDVLRVVLALYPGRDEAHDVHRGAAAP